MHEKLTSQESYLTIHSEQIQQAQEHIMSAVEYRDKEHSTPYVFSIERDGVDLLYYGSRHSKDPEDAQLEDIKERFDAFEPDLVLVESIPNLSQKIAGKIDGIRTVSPADSVREMGEPGFTLKLAIDNEIAVDSPEPSEQEEVHELLKQGFSKEDVFAYYFFRQLSQHHSKIEKEGVQEYFEGWIRIFKERIQWDNFEYSLEHAQAIAKRIWGEEIQFDNPEYYVDKVDPIPWEDTEDEQTIVNEIARQSNQFRDIHMIAQLAEYFQKYKRVFIVFGASHAVMQEPALRKLLEQ